jgi:hypothetical protein
MFTSPRARALSGDFCKQRIPQKRVARCTRTTRAHTPPQESTARHAGACEPEKHPPPRIKQNTHASASCRIETLDSAIAACVAAAFCASISSSFAFCARPRPSIVCRQQHRDHHQHQPPVRQHMRTHAARTHAHAPARTQRTWYRTDSSNDGPTIRPPKRARTYAPPAR